LNKPLDSEHLLNVRLFYNAELVLALQKVLNSILLVKHL